MDELEELKRKYGHMCRCRADGYRYDDGDDDESDNGDNDDNDDDSEEDEDEEEYEDSDDDDGECKCIGNVFHELTELWTKKNAEVESMKNAMEKQQAEWDKSREDNQNCVECDASESEQNVQLCVTCNELKDDDFESIKRQVLCAGCAIKKHMRNGHETVDFYPYLRAHSFHSHSVKFTSASENLKNARDLLNNTVKKFNELSENASENFNTLTDMARRSNSTKNQGEFFEKIKIFANESKMVYVNADMDLKKHTDILEKNLAIIKTWCEEKAGNCVDENKVFNFPTDGQTDGKPKRRTRKRKTN